MSLQPNTYYQQGMYTPNKPSVWPSPIFPQADIPALIQDPCSGEVFLNPIKSGVTWFYLANNPFPTGITAGFGSQDCSLTPPLEQGNSGDMEVVKLMSTSTGRFSVLLTDTWTNRKYMNAPVANNLVFGTSFLPFGLFETIFLPATTSLAATVTDLSGAPNDIRLVAAGRRFTGQCGPKAALQGPFISRRTHAYWLTFDTGPDVVLPAAPAGTRTTVTMTVPSSADFESWLVMDDSTLTAEDAVSVRILEGTSGRILMNNPLQLRQFVASPTQAVAGFPGGVARASGFPFAWTFTHLFRRATQVQIEFTNNTALPQTMRLAFHGRLIYYGDCPGSGTNLTLPRTLQQPYMPMPAPPNWLPCAPSMQAPGMTSMSAGGPAMNMPAQMLPTQQAMPQGPPPGVSPVTRQLAPDMITALTTPVEVARANPNVRYDQYGRQMSGW